MKIWNNHTRSEMIHINDGFHHCCTFNKQDVKETMTTIDEQLTKVISEDRIYTSKLIAHLDWYEPFKHLIVATSILEKRFILLDEYDEMDLKSISKGLYFYEVMKESEKQETYSGISNIISELDWLGKFSFILSTDEFNSKTSRQLIERNYHDFIFLENYFVENIESLQIDLCTGFNLENRLWGFCWVRHDHPCYMEKGILCPRKNCITEELGVIWCTREEADLMMLHISKITRKFNRKGGRFKRYTSVKDFLDEFQSMMKMISKKTMNPAELEDWSIRVLSEYSVV